MRAACEACGVRYGRDVAGGFVTHDGRHTTVTRMLHAGTDLATIGSITGHKDKTLILHYGHATAESRDGAIDVLDDFAGKGIGRSLDTVPDDLLILSGIGKGWCRRSDSNRHVLDRRQILSLVRIPISPLRREGQTS